MKARLSRRACAVAVWGGILLGWVGASDAKPAHEAVQDQLVSANTRFGFKLYAELLKSDAGNNIFVSPSSIAIALAMTYNGARGDTQQAMASTLELQGMSLEEINHGNAALLASLEQLDPKVELAIANSLWAKQDTTFNPEFIKANRDFYKAEVEQVDFADPTAAASRINGWVSEETRGKIDDLIEASEINEPGEETVLFLINAIYFKGRWTTQFDKAQTKEGLFTLLDGTQKQHPMMSQSGSYRYYKGEHFQAISLPYGKGRVSMHIFLPDEDSSLQEFHETLTAENWERWMARFSPREGDITLPRFTLEYAVDLNDTLKALGMEIAFTSDANFKGMAFLLDPLYIDKVKHKTFVEVNEEGTEAAAATSVGMITVSAMRIERFRMIVDRPFFCAIRDNETSTVLFMGSIVEPM